jgi:hypothetical protein
MANYLGLVNGVPRGATLPGTTLIYDQSITVVASGAGANQINGPVSSGTPITLPASGTYTLNANSIANINIYLNGDRMEQTFDWTTSGAGPNYTAFQFTFILVVGDRLDIRAERT